MIEYKPESRLRPGLRRSKWQRRAGLVATNSLNNLLPMLLTPLVSLLVIRQTSPALWGAFVEVMIMVQLGIHVAAWGNDAYLLRAFSRQPARIAWLWQSCFRTRLLLFLGLVALLAVLVYPRLSGWVLLWAVALMLHQSCAVLVTYKRDFLFASVVELAGLGVMISAVLSQSTAITPDWLLKLFALVTLARAAALGVRYRDIAWKGNGHFGDGRCVRSQCRHFQPRYFSLALPFFLLGFSGMLNSRIDLYIVNAYFSAEDVGVYQIFSSFLLYIQALAAFILLPFVKTIYRLSYVTIRKMSRSLFVLGGLIVPLALIALVFLLERLYGIFLSSAFFWIGGLAILPVFYFLPIIHALYKAEKQTTVLMVNFSGIAAALILNLIWLPRWGLLGAIISMAVIKWLTLLIYVWQGRRLSI